MGLFDDLQGSAGGQAGSDRGAAARRSGDGKPGSGPAQKSKPGTGSKKGKPSGGGKSSGRNVPAVAGEVVPTSGGEVMTEAGAPAELIPHSVDDVITLLPSWLEAWQAAHDVPDVRKASPLLFGSLCMEIGRLYVKPSRILRDTTIRPGAGRGGMGSTCGAYNPAAVMALFYVFRAFCQECDKIPFSSDFADFCGVSLSYIRGYGDKLTSIGLEIGKKTREAELEAVRRSASRDPVGRLAILNNEFWGGAGSGSGSDASVQAVDSIPAAASFGLLEGPKLD